MKRLLLFATYALTVAVGVSAGVATAQEPSNIVVASGGVRSTKDSAETSWKETRRFATTFASQGAAADARFVYGISNAAVAKLDRQTGELIALSEGEAKHLNAGVFVDGRLLLAHSNYPRQPESSQVMSLDPATMKLSVVKDFGESDGSLVWVLRHEGHWWANFAFYNDEFANSYLARFDDDWTELQRWTYPTELLDQLGRSSLSGGIWREGELLATGHDDKILFRLRVPMEGRRLELVGTERIAFTGQGFAEDPVTGGLVGIDRAKRQIIFVEAAK